MKDERITDAVEIGVGEGFATLRARFAGRPAFVVDCATLRALDEDDSEPVEVHVFESEAARTEYIRELLRRFPQVLGDPVGAWE